MASPTQYDPAVVVAPAYVPVTRDWTPPAPAVDHDAATAVNWTPTGAPQPGDTLTVHKGTLNVEGNGLAGDQVLLGQPGVDSTITFNLSQQAGANLETVPGSHVTLNLNSTGGNHDTNLYTDNADVHVTLADGDLTADSWSLTDSTLDVTGGTGFLNTGVIGLSHTAAFIHDDLEGTGSLVVGAGSKVEFGASVSYGQSVEVSGDVTSKTAASVVLDQPQTFGGSVSLDYGHVDLKNLVGADSYSFKNDVLSIYSGNTVLDSLRLTVPGSYPGAYQGFTVSQSAYGVVVDNSGWSQPGATVLAAHVG